MTVREAIITLNANVVFACERAGFASATVRMVEDALDTIEDALKAQGQEIEELKQEIEGHKDNLQETLDVMMDYANKLKAQEPRVMTVSEIGVLVNGDVVWVEFTDGRLLPMMVEDGCLMRWRSIWRICEDAFYDENYKARAWTSRPTEAEREAVKWE